MDIYCLIETDDFDTEVLPQAEAIETAINAWLVESRSCATLFKDLDRELLGLRIETNKKATLKKPLDFLNTLTKPFSLNFVVGLFEQDEREDICYFGVEEGRADIGEIANYLGIEK